MQAEEQTGESSLERGECGELKRGPHKSQLHSPQCLVMQEPPESRERASRREQTGGS